MTWPLAGLTGGFLLARISPGHAFSLQTGLAAWVVVWIVVMSLAANPICSRMGVVFAGWCLAIPCFVSAPPLFRFVLMALMAMPFVAAFAFLWVPPIRGVRERLGYLCSWGGKRHVRRCRPRLHVAALFQLLLSTLVCAAAVAAIKIATVDRNFFWRWLGGGIACLALAEMATAALPLIAAALGLSIPQLMQSPWWSTSLAEFWAKRWNPAASVVFRECCFGPLARRGPGFALFAAFAVSGIAHALLAYLALGRWGVSLACGAFFVVQPAPLAIERRLQTRRWPPAARHAWTLGVLTIVSPLFVEPMLQIVEQAWGPPQQVWLPTIVTLGFVLAISLLFSVISWVSRPPAETR